VPGVLEIFKINLLHSASRSIGCTQLQDQFAALSFKINLLDSAFVARKKFLRQMME
jgi:hypothetical protein